MVVVPAETMNLDYNSFSIHTIKAKIYNYHEYITICIVAETKKEISRKKIVYH